MKQVKWRVLWRQKITEASGYNTDYYDTRALAEDAAGRLNGPDKTYDYWCQPETVDVPVPKPDPPNPPETFWRMHWRRPDGEIDKLAFVNNFDTVKRCVAEWASARNGTTYWLQPDGTEPALKPGTEPVAWRVHYRNPRDLSGSEFSTTQPTVAEANAVLEIDRVYTDGTLEYWVQPELAPAEEKPKPEPPKKYEPRWRCERVWIESGFTREASRTFTDGARTVVTSTKHPQEIADWCNLGHIQSDALLDAKLDSLWKAQNKQSNPQAATLAYCGVEVRGSIVPGHEPNGQPVKWCNQRFQGGATVISTLSRDLAESIEFARDQQRLFPDWKCWIRAIEPADKPESCHAVWKVWCQRRSGGAVSQVSTPYGVTLDREAAEKLAKRYDDGTPLWRYWAQPACEEAKAPPPEPLYQVWGRCPDGTRFNVNEPSPYRTASDLAARLYLQTKLKFIYGIADA